MAFVHVTRSFLILSCICIVAAHIRGANGQLTDDFYATTCPNLRAIVLQATREAIANLPRNAAFLLRMHFHDCFVNGCDGSILLDDTASFTGEKGAAPNANSIQGYGVIDAIKAKVEAACSGTVSCADILALAAQSGVNLIGGPAYRVPLGRRDATTASQSAANNGLPGPGSSLASLIQVFGSHGLSARDMTALSGAHTIGFARCSLFRTHIYNETNIDPAFAATRQATCPFVGGDSNLAPIDLRTSGPPFDVGYYQDLVNRRGLLHSDQELFNGGSQDSLVLSYSTNKALFFADFAAAMIRMGNISPLTGTAGEIRKNCRMVN